MLIAGLTGNYGMGKSFVLSLFGDFGAATLQSDRIVDALLRENGVAYAMNELLGQGVMDRDGRLDKKAVAERIFNDTGLRKSVESLLHPLVLEKVDDFAKSMRDRGRIVIVEVPLLFEGNYGERFRKVITVYASEETAISRLEAAGISRRDALLRLKSQMPISRKKELADYTIDNNGSREETREQVREVYLSLLKDIEKRN
jgi:dephospho-CoA kinase